MTTSIEVSAANRRMDEIIYDADYWCEEPDVRDFADVLRPLVRDLAAQPIPAHLADSAAKLGADLIGVTTDDPPRLVVWGRTRGKAGYRMLAVYNKGKFMTKSKTLDQFVLIDGTGAERARGTVAEIGDAILSYDGRSWSAAKAPEGGRNRWVAYRYVGSKIETLDWLAVTAVSMAEALDKLALAAFAAGGNGRDHYLSVMSADEFDAAEEGDEA